MMSRMPLEMSATPLELPDSVAILVVTARGSPGDGGENEIRRYCDAAIEECRPDVLVLDIRQLKCPITARFVGTLICVCSRLRDLDGTRHLRVLIRGSRTQSLQRTLDATSILPFLGGQLFADIPSALESAGVPLSQEMKDQLIDADAESSPSDTARPRPLIAVLLSILAPGLGHVYAGATGRGFALGALLYLVLIPALTALMIWASRHTFWPIPVALLAILSAIIAVHVDAWRRAKLSESAPGTHRLAFAFYLTGFFLVQILGPASIGSRVESLRVPSVSMEPVLLPGDYFLADPRAYRHEDPSRGDVVVFRSGNGKFVKRVAGIPGDAVDRQGELADDGGRELAPNKYFLVGDNRDNSRDSRHLGPIDRHDILARVSMIHWSWDEVARQVRWERVGRRIE